jgi:hypothetical protein
MHMPLERVDGFSASNIQPARYSRPPYETYGRKKTGPQAGLFRAIRITSKQPEQQQPKRLQQQPKQPKQQPKRPKQQRQQRPEQPG